MSNKIIFHSNRIYNDVIKDLSPTASIKKIPLWWKQASRDFINEKTNKPFIDFQGDNVLNFKACPALLDIFNIGYLYLTPCDIKIVKKDDLKVPVMPNGFADFCGVRKEMPGFSVPHGYSKDHFHWYPNWAPSLPKGYSAMYISPINRFDLPFITVSGIIDNDNMDTPGLIPFFLKEDFEGIIPAGTPYMQVIPFKREDWELDLKYYTIDEIQKRHVDQGNKFRIKGGGAYKKHVWSRKQYK